MRSALVVVLAALTAAVAAAPASAGTRWPPPNCSNAVGPQGLERIPIGPLAAVGGAEAFADPGFFARNYDEDTGLYGAKVPMLVRKGKVVTVSIARSDRGHAWLAFSGNGRRRDKVTFTACRRGRGHGRRFSAWPGGYRLDGPRCLDLVARERGSRRVHRATVSFGMGDACATSG